MIDILIVEDDEILAELYKEIGEEMGLKCLILNTTTQISAFMSSNLPFKIGIFDLNLGIIPLNGRYLLDIFKFKGYEFIPIVVSGEISDQDRENFHSKGIQYIIHKPVSFEQFTHLLDTVRREKLQLT